MTFKSIWKEATGPSAGLVQKHYVAARKEALAARNPDLEEQLREFLERNPATRGEDWLAAYHKIQKRLQSAELTLNFDEVKWFSEENIATTLKYDSYSQMYERSVGDKGQNFLMDSLVNSGSERARIDDAVTFPQEWTGGDANAPARRGLMAGRQSGQRIQTQMQFGQQKPIIDKALWSDTYGVQKGVKSMNPHFNAKAKQVFAALNYGRRPHGSSIFYGNGFLILNNKLKVNALYYPGDTFCLPEDTSTQVAYGVLGSILAFRGNPHLRKAIIQSCYNGISLDDTKDGYLLVEAHIFDKILFSRHLVAVCLPATQRDTAIHANAKRFAQKYGATFLFT